MITSLSSSARSKRALTKARGDALECGVMTLSPDLTSDAAFSGESTLGMPAGSGSTLGENTAVVRAFVMQLALSVLFTL
jgi:hypothetical protein